MQVLLAGWMTLMPRSPAFLASRGQTDQARAALQWLRARQEVEEELQAVLAEVERAKQAGQVNGHWTR